jgi:hypothetical protein
MTASHGTALITGASSGIGAEFARQLAAGGYDLLLVARREERLQALAADLQARHGIQAETLAADLSVDADIARVETRIAAHGNITLLVNNAGFNVPGPFSKIPFDRALEMVQLHVTATMRLTRAVLPGMVAWRSGAIINVSSGAALVPLPGTATYNATKAYLNMLSECLSLEVGRTGVVVQALCPGFTHTELTESQALKDAGVDRLPRWMWQTSDAVVATSLRALRQPGRAVVVPGLHNRIMFAIATFPLVRGLVRWSLRRAFR